MPFKLHFYAKQSDPKSAPYCFSNPTTRFETVEEARHRGKQDSLLPKMGAHSFAVEDVATSRFVERWVRDGDDWSQADA